MVLLDALSASPAFFISAVLVLGLLVGSFLNVVIYRVPVMLERDWRAQCAELAQGGRGAGRCGRHRAAVQSDRAALELPEVPGADHGIAEYPRHQLPGAARPLRALQCAHQRPLSADRSTHRSALGAVAWKFGYGTPALAALVLTWFLIALTFIDVDTQLLPDSLTLPLVWLGLAASAFLGAAPRLTLPVDLHDSVVGAMAGYLSLWSIYHLFKLLTGKEGMGYGDFKLLAAIGAFLGWRMLLPTVLGAAAVGRGGRHRDPQPQGQGTQRADRLRPVPVGLGWLMLMWGNDLLAAYMGLFCRARLMRIGLTGGHRQRQVHGQWPVRGPGRAGHRYRPHRPRGGGPRPPSCWTGSSPASVTAC